MVYFERIDILECKECYSNKKRVTPLLKAKDCLQNHRQYVCSTCGRCICASIDDKGRYRSAFPFKSLEIAKLYLRAAEVINNSKCEIYEIENLKGRKSYKIFVSDQDLDRYLNKNKDKLCLTRDPLFKSKNYGGYAPNQLRHLTHEEVITYLIEKQQEIN